MALFSIIVDIAARTANIEEGLNRVEQRLSSFGSAVNAIGSTLSVGAFAAFADHLIDMASELDHAAIKAGVSITAFQELSYAAKQSGVDTGGLETALVRMNRALSMASTGGKQQTDTLRALGLSMKDLEGLSPDKQFEILAEQINKLPTAADKARAEIVLFGRAGYEMGVLISQGAEGVEALRRQAETLGGVMSEETVRNLEESHKAIDRLETSFSNLAATLLGKVAPGLNSVLDQLTKLASGEKGGSSQFMIDQLTARLAILQDHPILGNILGVGGSKSSLQKQLLTAQSAQNMNNLTAGAIGGGPDMTALGAAPGFDATQIAKNIDFINVAMSKKYPLQDWEQQTRGLEASIIKEYEETMAKIAQITGLPADQGGITQEEADHRANAAGLKLQAAYDQIKPINIAMKKLFPIDQMDQAIHTFTLSMEAAMAKTVAESGSFGRNLLHNILQALEDRAIFDAIDAIGTALENALGMGGNKSTGGVGGLLLMGIGSLFGPRAGGGFVAGGQTYLVGEKGPELFTPGGNGMISPNGGGGMNFAPTYNIVAPNGDAQLRAALPGLLAQTAMRTKADMLDAFRRNNLRAPARA